MFFDYFWVIPAMLVTNLTLTMLLLAKMSKFEKFQTSEAHANLEMINQSLNRLSDIAEKLERDENVSPSSDVPAENFDSTRGKYALDMIRNGEDIKSVGKKLGISRSELELLVAAAQPGNG